MTWFIDKSHWRNKFVRITSTFRMFALCPFLFVPLDFVDIVFVVIWSFGVREILIFFFYFSLLSENLFKLIRFTDVLVLCHIVFLWDRWHIWPRCWRKCILSWLTFSLSWGFLLRLRRRICRLLLLTVHMQLLISSCF